MKNSEILGDALLDAIRQAVLPAMAEIVRAEIQAALGNAQATNTKATQKPYLSPKEAAEIAQCQPQTIRLYIRKGDLLAKHIGTRVLISRVDLDSFLSRKS